MRTPTGINNHIIVVDGVHVTCYWKTVKRDGKMVREQATCLTHPSQIRKERESLLWQRAETPQEILAKKRVNTSVSPRSEKRTPWLEDIKKKKKKMFYKKLCYCICDDNSYSSLCDYCLACRGLTVYQTLLLEDIL